MSKILKRFAVFSAIAVLCTGILFPAVASAGGVVIVHAGNKSELNRNAIAQIFLNKRQSFDDGTKAVPVEQENELLRAAFLNNVLKMSAKQVNRHWARLKFSGRGQEPDVLTSDSAIKERVASDPGAIGYIDESNVDSSVRVIYRF